ncbi:MAG: helix-turn-helix transcriptional regulator [Ruminococcus sp.]|nr:helix-turn-helix transcriptional regulator [Ruminococcus sp.]
MPISERIRTLRKELKLSQEAFGEKIGVSKGVIVNLELERAPAKDLMLKMICRTFNVNPLWLENGEGEMFLDTPDTILDDLAVEFDLSPTEKNIVANYLRMSPEDRRKVSDLLHKLLGE